MHVELGECLGIIGSNGAGKSTLTNVIGGALRPESGEVVFDGTRLLTEGPRERARRGLSRTFQGLRLFNDLTVRENILVRAEAMNLPAPARDTADILERLQLTDVADMAAGALPLARQKIIAVAQALVSRPRLTILDEPLAGLDSPGVAMVSQVIRSAIADGNRSIILIDHNVTAVAEVASRMLFMHNGLTILSGTTREVLGSPEVSELYFGKTAPAGGADPKAAK
jgi:branched-chain amino acid transport system ATP-binding protein